MTAARVQNGVFELGEAQTKEKLGGGGRGGGSLAAFPEAHYAWRMHYYLPPCGFAISGEDYKGGLFSRRSAKPTYLSWVVYCQKYLRVYWT